MTLTYFSKALIGCTQFNLYLPIGAEYEDMVQAGEKFQVLWLLHGGGGNYSEWARYTCIEKLAMDHKFAVVMPEGGYPMPLIYDACGTADYIYPHFLEFREFARSAGMEQDVIFEEEPGEVHCWDFWGAYIARFVDRLPLKNRNFWRKWNDSQMWK